jgi:competence protein ComEC
MKATYSQRMWEAFAGRPLFWAFGAAAAGAALAGEAWAGAGFWGAVALAALLGVLIAGRARTGMALPLLLGLAAWAGLAARGASRVPAGDVAELAGRHVQVRGVIVSEPEPVGEPKPPPEGDGKQRWRFLLRCDRAWMSGGTRPVAGLLSVTGAPPGGSTPQFGERLLLAGIPRRPRGRSSPGGRSRAEYLERQRVWATLRPGVDGWQSLGPAAPAERPGWTRRLRQRALLGNQRALSPRTAYLVNGLILGKCAAPPGVDEEGIETAFRNSGTIHILVVSGTQVTLLLLPLLWLCRRWLPLRRAAALLVVPACLFYTGLAGGEVSLLRAAAMGILFAASLAVWREPDLLNTLGFAGLALLWLNPLSIHDLGFLLSFAAVWGVGCLGPILSELLRRAAPALSERGAGPFSLPARGARALARGIGVVLGASAGAYLATAPLLSYFLQSDARVAPLANVPAVPVAGLLLYAGALHSGWAALGPPPHWFSAVVERLGDLLWGCVSWFAALPGGHGPVFPLTGLALAAIFLLLALAAGRGRARLRPAFACLTLAGALLGWGERRVTVPPRWPEVTFIDVGQGDSTLVRLPDGRTMLVDGGGIPRSEYDPGEKVVLPALRALRVGRLDLVVATHPHDDHVGGLPSVVEGMPISLFLDSGQVTSSPLQRRLLQSIHRYGVPFRIVHAGQSFPFGMVRVEVLGPPQPFLAGTRSDLNCNSVVLGLAIGGRHLLLTGDAEEPSEAKILARGVDLQADVLKLGHHGSRYSTTDAWLQAVCPRVAVACCGEENRFGHPHPETVDRLKAAGVRFYRTDRDGAVTVTFEPEGLRVWRELAGVEEQVPDQK